MFEYKVEIGGETHVLEFKPLSQVPIGILRRNRSDTEGQMWDMFEWGLSPEHLAILDELPAEDNLQPILAEWQKHDRVEAGESDASPNSSTSTARRSKPTSSTRDSD